MHNCYYYVIAFDFDGTLVDTMHEYGEIAANEMVKRYDLSLDIARQLYVKTSGIPFSQQLKQIFGHDARNSECANQFEIKKAKYLESVDLSTTTIEVLETIKKLGLSIAVTSNNFQRLIDNFLERNSDLFDLVLGFGDGFMKGPTQFNRVIDFFGIDRRHMLFVGDSLNDARIGLACGFDTVAISGTSNSDIFTSLFEDITVIDRLYELILLLKDNTPLINTKFGKIYESNNSCSRFWKSSRISN
ncbi:MAG: HAD family hydrolase [archaeon]